MYKFQLNHIKSSKITSNLCFEWINGLIQSAGFVIIQLKEATLMPKLRFIPFSVISVMISIIISFSCRSEENLTLAQSEKYEDLVDLFQEFCEFQKPPMSNGIPDYSTAAMEEQRRGLNRFQDRINAMDISAWPVSQQVDYHLVRAEMNGLEFTHRVLRPWSRDPCFYLPSQGGAGPVIDIGLRIPENLPITSQELREIRERLVVIPAIYDQAKNNLREAAKDFAIMAIRSAKEENEVYQKIAESFSEHHPDLSELALLAGEAVEDYGTWIEQNLHTMTAKAGVGKENYNWWLKNVHLFPYTWDDCLDIVEREDDRVMTFLKLEENRNRKLPPLEPVSSQEEYKQSVKDSLEHVMNFLREEEIFSIPDFLTTEEYFGSWHDFDRPWPEHHDYFFNFSHRESLPEETHECIGHYFDELRHKQDNRPIRGVQRLFQIDWIRSEGFAFALEELLMHAGYLDTRPRRGREVVYEQAAFRTCRALADLRMHSHEFTLEQAMEYAVACAPHGELLEDSPHLHYEMQTTLRFVGWHMGMVVGKAQFMELIRDRAKQLGDEFNLRQFMDDFLAAGMIPMSLIRWEMTGMDDQMKVLLDKN
jgi:hypothetical protein